jgi:hypothetical protein
MLADALRQLGTTLVAMTAEEVAELLGDDDADGTEKAALTTRHKAIPTIIKAGRVPSSANEDALTQARDLINGVLAQLEPVDAEEEPGEEGEPDGEDDDVAADKSAIDLRRRRAVLARLKAVA